MFSTNFACCKYKDVDILMDKEERMLPYLLEHDFG